MRGGQNALRGKWAVLQIARDMPPAGNGIFQHLDYEGVEKCEFRGMEAALIRLNQRNAFHATNKEWK
jgi:hypothetical protein